MGLIVEESHKRSELTYNQKLFTVNAISGITPNLTLRIG